MLWKEHVFKILSHDEFDDKNLETAAVAALRCGGRDILGSAIDSWRNWSRDSHWFVFTSRRGDGLYTRLYLACIDDKGNVSKPFLLPQRNPKKYNDELLDSYNTPDFTSKPVELDARAAGNDIMSDKRIPTKVR